MMTSYDALFPGDEIQLLIDTYLPSDDQYYTDDLVLENKGYNTDILQRGLGNHSNYCATVSSTRTQGDDLPPDILDFISNAATDTGIFTSQTETLPIDRYVPQMMHNVFDMPYPNGSYNPEPYAVRPRNPGRSPTLSECSSSDNESSIDGSLQSDFIPLPVQSFKEGGHIDMESFGHCERIGGNILPDTDDDSIPCSPEPESPTIATCTTKQRRKRPSRRRQKQLWEFILETLTNPKHNPECITWVDKDNGIFKFVKSQQVARLWGQRRQREMSYEYFSRAMRHYYSRNIMKRVPGKRLVYQFLNGAEGWRQYAMKSPQ